MADYTHSPNRNRLNIRRLFVGMGQAVIRVLLMNPRRSYQAKPNRIKRPNDKGAMLLLDALDRLRVEANHWVQTVDALPHVLRSAAARSENLRNEAQRRGICWLHGIRLGQEHFG